MGTIARKGLQQYLLQLQRHPLRTKVRVALSKLGYVQKFRLVMTPVIVCNDSNLGQC